MRINNKLLGVFLFAVLVLLFLFMAGFFTQKLPTELKVRDSQTSVSDLTTYQLELTSEPVKRAFPGVIVAQQQADIAARLTASVVEVLVNVGDEVKQGDVLARLESDDLDARVRQTEQALSSAQAQLNAARKEFVRLKALLDKKLIPQSQFDQGESRLKSARAAFNQAQAAVSEAETTFGFSIIRAPFDGVITQKPVNRGDVATPGALLLSLYNPDSLEIAVNFAESVMPFVDYGKQVMAELPSYQLSLPAQVKEVTPSADVNSRSYSVRLSFETDKIIYPGSYAKIELDLTENQVLRVPSEAVYQVGQLDYVKVVSQQGDIVTRLVQLGEEGRVRAGLAPGEVVVLNPVD
ncbi:efflux RND transporter periplasmic adaptor subunit [Vibrio sp. CAU 1672]|uniref:efflux RND transporter periplasmic adaptor subunit n=1 Tax=Vibrio sp. CAU 1672 TaxID=3032594 RepID=UPI0023DA3250|nr:efflux RND transporter periplasmic adaptor subunit [Vibrio sp. CAU 1672]MDF2154503.1 efflux RND transporter periplasmic adaptor subunit [Vibrio sp. CAU 1672]